MFSPFVRRILNPFVHEGMGEDRQRIERVIGKHAGILSELIGTITLQFFFAIRIRVEEPAFVAMLVGTGFLSVMLFGSWFKLTVRDMSARQRQAGIDDLVTGHVFRPFLMSMSMFLLLMVICMLHVFLPEAHEAIVMNQQKLHVGFQIMFFAAQLYWMFRIFADVIIAAIAYDAADYIQEEDAR